MFESRLCFIVGAANATGRVPEAPVLWTKIMKLRFPLELRAAETGSWLRARSRVTGLVGFVDQAPGSSTKTTTSPKNGRKLGPRAPSPLVRE
jgi:hypothetical protein